MLFTTRCQEVFYMSESKIATIDSNAQDYINHLGVQVHQSGAARNVLVAQADLGFAFVSEKCLEDVLALKGKPLPICENESLHRRTDLTLACIAAVKPETTDVEAAACIARAFVAENPDCYADLAVDADTLSEVLNAGEAKVVNEYALGLKKLQAEKEVVLQTRQERLHTHFKKSAPPKYSAAEKKLPRWLPKKDEGNTEAITQWLWNHMPSSVTVLCDDYNGRWRVISANLQWRSISWTKRGYEKAAMEVVHQAWEYHYDYCGSRAPFDLDALAKRWKDDAPIVA